MSIRRSQALQRVPKSTSLPNRPEESRAPGPSPAASGLRYSFANTEVAPSTQVQRVLSAPGRPLDQPLLQEMETRLGANFSTVRIHSDPAAERSAMAVDARAYTSGEHIVGGPGALDRPTIAHELTHVLQQRGGPVAGNDHGDGLRVSDPSDRFEREADANATGVMNIPAPVQRAATPAPPAEGPAAAPPSAGVPIVQRATVRDHTMAFETPAYTPNNGRAGRVSVNNIRGKPLGEAANSPTPGTRPIGWDELYNAGHTHANPNANKSHYNAVKMHLMNGRLGGPGTNVNNLAPGPASINSSMSAGPEKAAKAAVSAGKFIWLETSVTYQNNTVNANDFTSVVPNSMTMSWGYMANRSPTNFTRGPAQGPAWSETIDQPAGALTVAQQTAYQGFTNTVDLDAQLNAGGVLVSHQELAQAYTLVATAALQKHMLLNYHAIYRGMDETAAATALMTLTAAEAHAFATTFSGGDLATIAVWVLEPLYNAAGQATLQGLFPLFSTAQQLTLALWRGGEILPHIGNLGVTLAETDRRVFNLHDNDTKDGILDNLTAVEIDNLFRSGSWYPVISGWCDRSFGGTSTADERAEFLEPKLSTRMMDSYENNILRWQRDRDNPRPRKSPRLH